MKKTLIILSIILNSISFASAQEVYSSTDTVRIQGPNKANDDDFADLEHGFVFKNINAITHSFRWVRTVNNLPSAEWESAVCDINLCYPSAVDSADFEMETGDSGIFYPHFYPGKGVGNAEMVIEIFNIDNRNQKVTVHVFATAWDAYNSVLSLSNNSNFKLYPNPTNNHTIVRIEGSQDGICSLKNMEGKTLILQNITQSDREINTQALPQGVYIVEWNDGKYIRTQKLIIN